MIFVDTANATTILKCEACSKELSTGAANGVVPDTWLTGHLWIDASISEQKQIPLCFCDDCKEDILAASGFVVTGAP